MPEEHLQSVPVFYRIYFYKLYTTMGGYGGFAFYSNDSYLHQHMDFYELILITNGTYYNDYDGETKAIGFRDLLMFKPGTVHSLHCPPLQATHFVICVRKDFFEEFVKRHFPEVDLAALPDFVQRTVSAYAMAHIENLGHIFCDTQRQHDGDSIVYNMLSSIFYAGGTRAVDKRYDYVDDIINLFNDPLQLNLTVEEICNRYPVSRPTLLKNFKQKTGCSIVEYKAQRRLMLAAQLLENVALNLTITDVCNSLGYDSLSYFLRAFKKKYGITPSEYRARHRAKTGG